MKIQVLTLRHWRVALFATMLLSETAPSPSFAQQNVSGTPVDDKDLNGGAVRDWRPGDVDP